MLCEIYGVFVRRTIALTLVISGLTHRFKSFSSLVLHSSATVLLSVFCCSPGRKERVSSLQSLVCWYQEHSCSCPHEPQLRALEPQPNFSTAAIWQCDSDHSFVQYLFSPPREASDSEQEGEVNGEGDGENVAKTDMPVAKGVVSRKRRKDAHKQFRGTVMNVIFHSVRATHFNC